MKQQYVICIKNKGYDASLEYTDLLFGMNWRIQIHIFIGSFYCINEF